MPGTPAIAREISATAAPPREVDGGPQAFRARLDEVLRHARRSGEGFALLILDLDGFREVNDTFARAVADAVLFSARRRLHETVRLGDFVAHVGGYTFGLLLIEADDEDGTARALGRIVRAFAEPLRLGDASLVVTVSVGGCLWSPGVQDAGTLLGVAQQAMVRAKSAGGGQCHLIVAEPSGDAGPTATAC